MNQLFIKTNIHFDNYIDALTYISTDLQQAKVVKPTHLTALLAREQYYPTGIALEDYAVAIPHCEAEHSITPAIYLLKTDTPLLVNRADEESQVAVRLIIALVVNNPTEQLSLLKTLFTQLQNKTFYQSLMDSSEDEMERLFTTTIFARVET